MKIESIDHLANHIQECTEILLPELEPTPITTLIVGDSDNSMDTIEYIGVPPEVLGVIEKIAIRMLIMRPDLIHLVAKDETRNSVTVKVY